MGVEVIRENDVACSLIAAAVIVGVGNVRLVGRITVEVDFRCDDQTHIAGESKETAGGTGDRLVAGPDLLR